MNEMKKKTSKDLSVEMKNFAKGIELSECDDELSQKRGSKIVWRNLCVYAKLSKPGWIFGRTKTTTKRIVNNCTGQVNPGTLLAVMGASGAGKSTLMSALAYRNSPGIIVKGDVIVDGQPIGSFMHRRSGFVFQDDLFNGSLTVVEHITLMVGSTE